MKEASDALDKAASVGGKDNPEVLRVQAYYLESNADYTAAVDAYRRAIEKAPERSYLHLSLGHTLRALKRLRRGHPVVPARGRPVPRGRARRRRHGHGVLRPGGVRLRAQPSGARAGDRPQLRQWLGSVGWVFYVQKEYDKAQPEFEKAVELEKDPTKNATYRHALGWIYLNTKQYTKAKEEFTRALEENPDLARRQRRSPGPGEDAVQVSDARRRVLLIYSRVGGGHLSAARALEEELAASGRAQTRLVDIYLECGRFPVTLFPRAYAELARNHPRLWSFIYHGSSYGLDATRVLRPFLRAGLQRCCARNDRTW